MTQENQPHEDRRVLWVAATGSLLSSLSASIVNVTMPRIGEWAGTDLPDTQWVLSVPLIVISVGLLPAGRAGDLFGLRRVFMSGLAAVGLGALVAAIAPLFWVLLVGRGIQGLGAAAMMASSPALVSLASGPGRRGRALGIVSTATYLGLTAGPLLGGVIETLGSFRAVFWVQAVLSLAGLPAAWLLPRSRPSPGGQGIDPVGVVLLAVGISTGILALVKAEDWGATSPGVVVSGVIALLGLAAFCVWEWRHPAPMLDLKLFRGRTFSSAAAGALLNYLALFQATFLLPFFLLGLHGLGTFEAGMVMTAMPLIMAIVAGPSGALSDRVGSRVLSATGMTVVATALLLLTRTEGSSGLPWLVGCLCLLGLGNGLFVSPNTNALMSSAPRERQGIAAGVQALARNLGMVIGSAVSALAFQVGRASVLGDGLSGSEAELAGFHAAYWVGGVLALFGAAVVLVRPVQSPLTQGSHRRSRLG